MLLVTNNKQFNQVRLLDTCCLLALVLLLDVTSISDIWSCSSTYDTCNNNIGRLVGREVGS